jgi:hypothetical protein
MHEELHQELDAHLKPRQKEALEKWEQRRCERREKYRRDQKCERQSRERENE